MFIIEEKSHFGFGVDFDAIAENMCNNRKSAALAGLLLVLVALPTRGCRNCNNKEVEDLTPSTRRVLLKKDIFMSRGWGAAGGAAYTPQDNSAFRGEFPKNPRIMDLREDDFDQMDEPMERQQIPLVQFLLSPPSNFNVNKAIITRGHRMPGIVPQLFISSGWGPLGK
ncbi:Hypothetical protein NTJ_07424 [Nesidiocoris tenuis]|uniref:Peptidase S1 domain-containing protein n=1 Tax=Nesidiocoris tenuis TaxID=355587 RepID=A0ABN7AQX1_9HEMI|nr:Hypothetical protein NTJ_07424 [Nesidiocoris tenuis]